MAQVILAKRPEHKFSLQHQLMRDIETRVRHDLVIVQKNVEIDDPRSLVDRLAPSQSILDGLQGIQQLNWVHGGLSLGRVGTTSESEQD